MSSVQMTPAPGERLVRHVGDRLQIRLAVSGASAGLRAFLRTNLTRARVARAEVIAASSGPSFGEAPFAGASWRDIPLERRGDEFAIDLPLLEVGHFRAKAYAVDPRGAQLWPEGSDVGVSVHPNALRTANLVYCAFARAAGEAIRETPPLLSDAVATLDRKGFTVIPPSGTLRDLARAVPHILGELGFRVLQLMPVGPVPTTHARMGRYGSPYAQLDLTGIDPALVEHDRRTTAVDQFRELADAVHGKDGLLFLDVVLNHSGWCARLLELHPEWYVRGADGTFESPGAWGVTWADLVEFDLRHVELWHELAEALLTWCRRGVDGFRCDAGYMVPVSAWQYVIARVRTEFPDSVFFLEGLGGAWEATEALLLEGGMQWAYSELFQNYEGPQVSGYLDHALRQSERAGLLVHYSETHDNERLAARGRAWSLLRNRLCALASSSGGYAITAGVEWLERAKIDVHEARSLGFGRTPNLVAEIAKLTSLLRGHPCFFDGARVERVSPAESPVLALARTCPEGTNVCLVLVNLDPDCAHDLSLDGARWLAGGAQKVDLLGGAVPAVEWEDEIHVRVRLRAGEALCLSRAGELTGLSGDQYRALRAQAAWAFDALGQVLPHESIGSADFAALARYAASDPHGFLGSLTHLDESLARSDLLGALHAARSKNGYAAVVSLSAEDARRVTLVPDGHWLVITDPGPFEVDLEPSELPRRIRSVKMAPGHVVAVRFPEGKERDVTLRLDRFPDLGPPLEAPLRVLAPRGEPGKPADAGGGHVLLTNGRGGMARIALALGSVTSKYDCLLGANLHAEVPCDRHVLVKRVRLWLNADGFITALDGTCTLGVDAGPPARWRFLAHAGDGRAVRVDLQIGFVPLENTVEVRLSRPDGDLRDTLPRDRTVRLTARLDLEDRSYHSETHASPEANEHFVQHTSELASGPGFVFLPAADRGLVARADRGAFHAEPEWSVDVPHPEEAARGLVDRGSAWSPGWFDATLGPGETVTLTVSAEPAVVDRSAAPHARPAPAAPTIQVDEDAFVAGLRSAARAYLVRRGEGTTVIAGYPWFLDWGRDSLIAARGLARAGFLDETRSILHTFAQFERGGTLPNFLVGEGAGSRESSDAPLWFALACDEYARARGDATLDEPVSEERTLADVLESIFAGYVRGTDAGVKVDEETGLVWSPPHFTWMDTNHPAGTPREGYPIELAVLFARLAELLHRLGRPATHGPYGEWAARVRASLSLFERGRSAFFADTLHAGPGVPPRSARPDDHLRPNQLFAVSLGLVEGERARRIVSAASRFLLVPGALRSLAPCGVQVPLPIFRDGALLNDPSFPYRGRYEGDEDTRRKPAYHNGTAWPWLLPTFCEALVRSFPGDEGARAAARSILGSAARLLGEGTLGQLPEILDGDAPHVARGCDAQAWSVTETLRVALLLQEGPS